MARRELDEEAIFQIARKLADPDDRSAYLGQICGGDQPLRERVEALLKVHEHEQGFLASESPDPPPTAEATSHHRTPWRHDRSLPPDGTDRRGWDGHSICG